MILNLVLIAVGFALLVFGANFLVDGACRLAARLGVPDRVVGLTIVAVGTSLPEVVVSVTSATSGYGDMALGNVMGSCLANLLLILGLAAIISPISLTRETLRFEIPANIAACALFALLANTNNTISTFEGVILLVAFAAFIARTAQLGLAEGNNEQEGSAQEQGAEHTLEQGGFGPYLLKGPITDIFLIVAGIALLKVGAEQTVNASVEVAQALGISERIIGLTIVALGTSLPELVTSVVAAMRGNADIAVGNVLGSNVANLLLVMGTPALFSSIAYASTYNIDLALLAVCTAALAGFALTGRRNVVGRSHGLIFVAAYFAFMIFSVVH